MNIFKENFGTLRCRLFGHSWRISIIKETINEKEKRCKRCNIHRKKSLEYKKLVEGFKWLRDNPPLNYKDLGLKAEKL